jgi:hypothetical protein
VVNQRALTFIAALIVLSSGSCASACATVMLSLGQEGGHLGAAAACCRSRPCTVASMQTTTKSIINCFISAISQGASNSTLCVLVLV